MFHKSKPKIENNNRSSKPRQTIPTVITSDVHILGNIVSDGAIDFSGSIDGNIRCESLTLREQGTVKGEINSGDVNIHGTVKGLIRSRNVHLRASCKVEGVIIHEQLSIEDGAFVDGKFKRSDRMVDKKTEDETDNNASDNFDNESVDFSAKSRISASRVQKSNVSLGDADVFPKIEANMNSTTKSGNTKILENIRLIR